jgi:aspartate/methionine/tyrosine aminotransferase
MVMDVLEAAQQLEAQGENIIHLEIGEPDFDTPSAVKAAAQKAIDQGHTHYTHSQGLYQLREAICCHYAQKYQVAITPDQVVVTSGTSPAMLLAFSALLEPGDEVLVTDPGYACYPNFIQFVNGCAVPVPVAEGDGFQPTLDNLTPRITGRTRAVLINSPSNPTGTLLDEQRLKDIASLGIPVISDEIYHGLVYEGTEHSILEYTNNAFVLNGFSKLYAMTGWRLGYLIAPKSYVGCIRAMAQNLFICAGSVAQWAGLAALTQTDDDVRHMRTTYAKRRRYMIDRLKAIGFGIAVEPTGAFYILANAQKFTSNSYDFTFEILNRAKVGVTPGVDFGKNAEGFIRFSYANSMDNIAKAMDRLEEFLRTR